MADYTNPRGAIFGYSANVVAEDERGNRVQCFVKADRFEENVLPQAERLAEALNARLAGGKLPVAFGQWTEISPRYGSDAYDPAEEADWEASIEDNFYEHP